jgi:hypothetical protein
MDMSLGMMLESRISAISPPTAHPTKEFTDPTLQDSCQIRDLLRNLAAFFA